MPSSGGASSVAPSTGGTASIGAGGSTTGGSTSGGGMMMMMGGAPATGGDLGTGGTVASAACDVTPEETTDLVDDMRLASNRILPRNGRTGAYLAFHGTAMDVSPKPNMAGMWPNIPMEEIPGATDDFALHYTSTKLMDDSMEEWHQFGFLLNDGDTYDLSSYTGILFCGQRIAEEPQAINLRIVDGDDNNYETSGGIIPTSWGIVKIPFDDGWDASALTAAKNVEFLAAGGVDYDIWIDNIQLYTE